MNLEEIQTIVTISAELRSPKFGSDDGFDGKVDRLENHMLACAHARGDLENAWRYCARLVSNLTKQLPRATGTAVRTARDREAYFQEAAPGILGALQEALQLKREIERQIDRLLHDEKTVSRAYTFITGNS